MTSESELQKKKKFYYYPYMCDMVYFFDAFKKQF